MGLERGEPATGELEGWRVFCWGVVVVWLKFVAWLRERFLWLLGRMVGIRMDSWIVHRLVMLTDRTVEVRDMRI